MRKGRVKSVCTKYGDKKILAVARYVSDGVRRVGIQFYGDNKYNNSIVIDLDEDEVDIEKINLLLNNGKIDFTVRDVLNSELIGQKPVQRGEE